MGLRASIMHRLTTHALHSSTPLPNSQAWDHAAGHSMQWNKQTAAAAFATAGVISAIAVFTEEPLPKAAKKA